MRYASTLQKKGVQWYIGKRVELECICPFLIVKIIWPRILISCCLQTHEVDSADNNERCESVKKKHIYNVTVRSCCIPESQYFH